MKRIFLIVLDSFGIGAMEDAAKFGDEGSNTLATVSAQENFHAPNLTKLGLFHIEGVDKAATEEEPLGAYARMRERSAAKDTVMGHWEIAGLISNRPHPTYPEGFPKELIEEYEKRTGRGVLANKPYSGTAVISEFAEEQKRTGKLIVYTSADSVFQVAAHEEYIGLEELYRCCEIARKMLQGEHAVGRVIARPYIGENGTYTRTANRHDYSIEPPANTVLDEISAAGLDVIGVGKIYDIFAGRGITESIRIQNNADGQQKVLELMDRDFHGLCFVNLVDFDAMYGHRNDPAGYAAAVSDFDRSLGQMMEKMGEDDLIIITADHGCDPGFRGTDHTREYVPLLCWGKNIAPVDLKTRDTFADIAATVAELLGVATKTAGTSFAAQLRVGRK